MKHSPLFYLGMGALIATLGGGCDPNLRVVSPGLSEAEEPDEMEESRLDSGDGENSPSPSGCGDRAIRGLML